MLATHDIYVLERTGRLSRPAEHVKDVPDEGSSYCLVYSLPKFNIFRRVSTLRSPLAINGLTTLDLFFGEIIGFNSVCVMTLKFSQVHGRVTGHGGFGTPLESIEAEKTVSDVRQSAVRVVRRNSMRGVCQVHPH
ncbi:hypothetical protein E2C01_078333 [Portunus trituberculatus]|uniref:Uncharacterized protein n=1 Tax=Portunus trituberculatus TaxID=210409 RepID=A0A5B7INK1_PORTR|nr:hypothetical protein [Portunus trituberculatus]